VANKPYVSYDVVYGADGKPASKTLYTAGNSVYLSESWNGDGSYTLHTPASGTAYGAAYTSYDVTYNASGKPTNETWSSGVTETWSYDPTTAALTEIVVSGIVNPNYAKTDTLYVDGVKASETWYTGGNSVYQSETWNSDNSYSIAYTRSGTAFGASYDKVTVNYNASGKPTSESWSGGAAEAWTYNNGAVTEIVVTGISGQSYVKADTLYTGGVKASATLYTSDGSVYLSAAWNWNTNGSYSIAFTGNGTVFGASYNAYTINYGASGKAMSESWSNGGSVTWSYNPDGNYETLATPPAGAAYTLDADIYSAAKVLEADARDLSGVSGALRLYANGATVTQGAGALSVGFGDTYSVDPHTHEAITATGTNSDSFSFASGFGQTLIAGFATQGASSDELDLQLSMFNSSWFTGATTQAQYANDLLAHATGATNTFITDLAGDTLTLLGVTSAQRSSIAGSIRLT
jgi:hypothetical protein